MITYQHLRLATRLGDTAYNALRRIGRLSAGLQLQRIDLGTERAIYYYDNQKQNADTVVLLHGFNADKDHWLRMASHLSGYRLIIPDLAGHGQSWYDAACRFDIPFHTTQLNHFMKALGIHRFHLLGNSMGGWIAAKYASTYPADLITLCLMSAAGVASPTSSAFFRALEAGNNPFFYDSHEALDELLAMAFARKQPLPGFIKGSVFRQGQTRMVQARKLFRDIINAEQSFFSSEQRVDDDLRRILHPTLILWGDRDGIMDASMADVFATQIPDAEKIILDNVGHTPMLEQPRQVARLYSEFLSRKSRRKN